MARRAPFRASEHKRLADLRQRLTEAEDTLNAIRSGAVDALVVRTPRGEQLFTLKGADQTYRALIEAMNEGAVTLNRGVISYCNNYFAAMVKTPSENVFGASITDLVPSENFRRFLRRLEKGREAHGSVDCELRLADGTRLPVRVSGSHFFSEGKAMVGLVITNISDRKEAERARQELSRSILIGQERERQRVARDLHDSVNQLLASARYRLNSITARSANGAGLTGLRQVLDLIEKAISEVRLISRNLRPSELDDLGLAAALRTLAHEFEKRSGIPARFSTVGTLPNGKLIKEAEMTLYRIAQESLNNVERHSGASRVNLVLQGAPAFAALAVHDNGHGFARQRRRGSGLQNMTERVALMGGRLSVTSAPGKGTRIFVSIPLLQASLTKPLKSYG